MNPKEWYPNLSHTDHELQRAVRIAFDSIYELRRRLNGTQSANPAQPPAVINQAVQQIMSGSWTAQMPMSGLTLAQISSSLAAKGSNPLNVQSLLGVLAQPQIGGAPTVTALPVPPSPTAQDGALVSLAGVLYRFNGSTSPGFWEALLANGVIAFGTRGTKPGSGASGVLYYETDTGWLYRGTGAGWAFIEGIDWGTDAVRAAIAVAATDNGAMFITTDTAALWRVEAGAWVLKYGFPSADGARFKGQNVTTGSIAASTYASVTLTWTTAFADANYTPSASVVEATASQNTLQIDHIESFNAAGVTVGVFNRDAGSAHTGLLYVLGSHN